MIPPDSSGSFLITKIERSKIGWFAFGLLAACGLLFVRNPYVVLAPQFWHEDALIFLNEERTLGLSAIVHPYAGYLHTYQRLIAALAGYLPLKITPLVFLVGAYLGWLATSALVLTSPLFANVRWALLAVIAGIAVPHSGEVMVNLTNVHWILATGLALLLAEPVGQRRASLLVLAYALLAGLSGAFSTVLAPVALWRLIQGIRRRVLNPTALVVFAGGILQFTFILVEATRLKSGGTVDWNFFSLLLGVGVFPEFLGTQSTFPADLIWRLTGTAAGVAGILWSLHFSLRLAANRRLLLSGAALLLLAGLVSCLSGFGIPPSAFGPGARYLYPPFVLFAWCLVSAWSFSPSSSRVRVLGVALLTASTFYSIPHFIAPKYSVPNWSEICRQVESGYTLEVGVPPLGGTFILAPARRGTAPAASPPGHE